MSECEHDYEVLEHEVETYYAYEETTVNLVAYCKKCLDIQVIEREIKHNKGID